MSSIEQDKSLVEKLGAEMVREGGIKFWRTSEGMIVIEDGLSPGEKVRVVFRLVRSRIIGCDPVVFEDEKDSSVTVASIYCSELMAELLVLDAGPDLSGPAGIVVWQIMKTLAEAELEVMDKDGSRREWIEKAEEVRRLNECALRVIEARICYHELMVFRPRLAEAEAEARNAAVPDFPTNSERQAAAEVTKVAVLPLSPEWAKVATKSLM